MTTSRHRKKITRELPPAGTTVGRQNSIRYNSHCDYGRWQVGVAPCSRTFVTGGPRIDAELQVLIQRMAAENRLWGSVRIKGELRKLGLEVSNSTVRRYRTAVRQSPARQSWSTFLQNHGPYLREALGEEVRERARGLLGMLPRLGSPARARLGSRSEMWPLQIPGEYLEPIEERWGEWWCDCPACERAPRAARDPPALRRDAA